MLTRLQSANQPSATHVAANTVHLRSSMVNETPFRVAIVGGGIGGLFAALSIHHHCHTAYGRPIQIDVYEHAAQFKECGAGIGFGLNASGLFHKIGLGGKLNALSSARNGTWFSFRRFDNGEDIVTLPADEKSTVRQVSCSRFELLQLLKDAVAERSAAQLHTNKACKKVEECGSSICLYFKDGTTAEADLVVGADGIHSSIRAQFVTDEAVYSGQAAYRDVIPTSAVQPWPFKTEAVAWLAKHKHFLVYPISQNKELNVVAFINERETTDMSLKAPGMTTSSKADVARDFEEFEPTVQRIISQMRKRPSKWRICDRRPLKKWHFLDGRVVLLGDAAHAMLPHVSAGVGQVIEDGWVLGKVLGGQMSARGPEGLSAAAELYTRSRVYKAQKMQTLSRAAGDTDDMQTEEMLRLGFDECCSLVAAKTRERMTLQDDDDEVDSNYPLW